jgi:hypothetical protein
MPSEFHLWFHVSFLKGGYQPISHLNQVTYLCVQIVYRKKEKFHAPKSLCPVY